MYILLRKCTLAVYIEECGNFFVTRHNKKSVSFIYGFTLQSVRCWWLFVCFLLFPPRCYKHSFLKLLFFFSPTVIISSQQLSGHTIILIRRKIHAGKAIGYVDMTTLFSTAIIGGIFFYCVYRGYTAIIGGTLHLQGVYPLLHLQGVIYSLLYLYCSYMGYLLSFYFPDPHSLLNKKRNRIFNVVNLQSFFGVFDFPF